MTENELHEFCDAAIKNNNLEHAFKICEDFIVANPKSSQGFRKRAGLYARGYDFNEAISDVSEAIRLSPNEASFYFFRGWWKFEIADFLGAEADQTLALKLESDQGLSFVSESSYFFRALARLRLGKFYETLADSKHISDDFLIYLKSVGKITKDEIVKEATRMAI